MPEKGGRDAGNEVKLSKMADKTQPRKFLLDSNIYGEMVLDTGIDVLKADEKTMLTENAVSAYRLVNELSKRRTPRFIGYKGFKLELRSCSSNKFVGSPDKLRIVLVFLNFLYQLVKINLFLFHKTVSWHSAIKSFALISPSPKNEARKMIRRMREAAI